MNRTGDDIDLRHETTAGELLELISRKGISSGQSKTAWEKLYRKYGFICYLQDAGLMEDEEAARDLVQNKFLKIWAQPFLFRNIKATPEVSEKMGISWILRMDKNMALKRLKKKGKEITASALEKKQTGKFDQIAGHYETLRNKEMIEDAASYESAVRKLEFLTGEISKLPRLQRMAILAFAEGLSYKQIALLLDRSAAAVRSLIYRGRETLRRRFDEYMNSNEAISLKENFKKSGELSIGEKR